MYTPAWVGSFAGPPPCSPPSGAFSVCRTALMGHQGVIATQEGLFPTATVAVTVFDARSITDTLLELEFVM